MTAKFENPISRLGVIGDPHTEDVALDALIGYFDQHGVEQIVCTGDVVTGRGNAERCCRLLRTRDIPTVRGNHDRWLIRFGEMQEPYATRLAELTMESVSWLTDLPMTIDIPTVADPAMLCHGLGGDDMAGVMPQAEGWDIHGNKALWRIVAQDHYRFVINGHTHHRMVRSFANSQRPEHPLTIINAGTLRRDHRPASAVVDFATRSVQFLSCQWGTVFCDIEVPLDTMIQGES